MLWESKCSPSVRIYWVLSDVGRFIKFENLTHRCFIIDRQEEKIWPTVSGSSLQNMQIGGLVLFIKYEWVRFVCPQRRRHRVTSSLRWRCSEVFQFASVGFILKSLFIFHTPPNDWIYMLIIYFLITNWIVDAVFS